MPPSRSAAAPVTYDANGNTLTYDPDGAGPVAPKSLAYDGENRPSAVTTNGNTARFDYGPDGERAAKSFLGKPQSQDAAQPPSLTPPATPAAPASLSAPVRCLPAAACPCGVS